MNEKLHRKVLQEQYLKKKLQTKLKLKTQLFFHFEFRNSISQGITIFLSSEVIKIEGSNLKFSKL